MFRFVSFLVEQESKVKAKNGATCELLPFIPKLSFPSGRLVFDTSACSSIANCTYNGYNKDEMNRMCYELEFESNLKLPGSDNDRPCLDCPPCFSAHRTTRTLQSHVEEKRQVLIYLRVYIFGI